MRSSRPASLTQEPHPLLVDKVYHCLHFQPRLHTRTRGQTYATHTLQKVRGKRPTTHRVALQQLHICLTSPISVERRCNSEFQSLTYLKKSGNMIEKKWAAAVETSSRLATTVGKAVVCLRLQMFPPMFGAGGTQPNVNRPSGHWLDPNWGAIAGCNEANPFDTFPRLEAVILAIHTGTGQQLAASLSGSPCTSMSKLLDSPSPTPRAG
ncbi:hypothetical protein GGI42DRAFT_37189 [Trichoderma sp. SZMC 28013]